MAKYKSLADEPLWVDVAGRLTQVDPGGIIDLPDDLPTYVQTGDHGEPALFTAVETAKKPTKNEEK